MQTVLFTALFKILSQESRRGAELGKISRASIKKTIYYFRRNGLKRTWYAVRERLEEKGKTPYVYEPLPREELERQQVQWRQEGFSVSFSIVVPAYKTRESYLREMIESVTGQTYPKWELVVADATEDDSVERAVQAYDDKRIRYIHLNRNRGIAENTNQALSFAEGDYVGLLDHDDVLEENALYEMAAAIEAGIKRGICPRMLYSDEDKCNGDRTEYYEPNRKEGFNLDLLLSNNYICHFLVLERELIKNLKFRREFEGAQDYDLVLRAACILRDQEEAILHIPKVLYHWRCHTGSTAENPGSKLYAYEAGRRALQDFADTAGWKAKALDTAHVGFYRLQYEGSLFDTRPDVGAVGGRLISRKAGACVFPAGRRRIAGGRLTAEGKAVYGGLPAVYSGYMHRAVLPQDAAAVDVRCIQVREECREIFRKTVGAEYRLSEKGIFDASLLPKGCDYIQVSLALCQELRRAGYRILFLPQKEELLRQKRSKEQGWKK